jgi:hypothetical protein
MRGNRTWSSQGMILRRLLRSWALLGLAALLRQLYNTGHGWCVPPGKVMVAMCDAACMIFLLTHLPTSLGLLSRI